MRVLVVGAGGVGSAFAHIAARRGSFEKVVIADYDAERAQKAAAVSERFSGVKIDASNEAAITELIQAEKCDAVLNAVDPRFVMPIFRGAFAAGVTYMDMAMSLSHPDPEAPYTKTGVKLGDEQFVLAPQWEERGYLPSPGWGSSPASRTCSPATPLTSSSPPSTSSACATAPTSLSTVTTSARPSPSGRRSRSA